MTTRTIPLTPELAMLCDAAREYLSAYRSGTGFSWIGRLSGAQTQLCDAAIAFAGKPARAQSRKMAKAKTKPKGK